jgi:glutaconate CoA-transferase subunit B
VPEGYTAAELMVACAAREIRDAEVVFVGMRLPLLAFALAKRLHAPRAVGIFESGIVRDQPAATLLYTMTDGANVAGALWCTRMTDVMALLHQGAVDVGFIGGAQMDRFGNLNTSHISSTRWQHHAGGPALGETKLPGSGGAADIAALAHRLLIIMQHERRRFVPKVDYVTSPGYGEGGDWRERIGLPQGGPAAAITTLGVLRFDPDTREAYLDTYHPGTSPTGVRANTGWDLQVAEGVRETPVPTLEELRIIREYDPGGFWTQ